MAFHCVANSMGCKGLLAVVKITHRQQRLQKELLIHAGNGKSVQISLSISPTEWNCLTDSYAVQL